MLLQQADSQNILAQTFTDSQNRVSLSIVSVPSLTKAGFTQYIFNAAPLGTGTEITSIGASFSSASMNQIHPGGNATVFNNFNFAISNPFDPLDDSQFTFSNAGLLIESQSESSSSLSATFTNFPGIQSSQPIARVVLPNTGTGTVDLTLVLRDIGVNGEGAPATFSNIAFGLSSVPEPSMVFVWSLLTVGAALRRRRGNASLTTQGIA